MDPDALKVINRLTRHGYRSYLVGGCVRDMILGRKPKDFDVVTTATPSQIRKVFSNSRAIGRRFKIVHVVFRGKIIEVSTFRSIPSHRITGKEDKESKSLREHDNTFGTPREDAARRDFTINSLFFDPRNESIIDYMNGFEDIKNGVINVIGDPDLSFREDSVRMLRAAKFAALLDFKLSSVCQKAIRRNREELADANAFRLLEEYGKIFRTGKVTRIFSSLFETGLLQVLFPEPFDAGGLSKYAEFVETPMGKRLSVAERMLEEREELTVNIFIALILADTVSEVMDGEKSDNLADFVKSRIQPVCKRMQIPGKDCDRLVQMFISQSRFHQKERKRRFKPEVFRQKNFFYEAFTLYKINALAMDREEDVQTAMFWEIGPRARPPENGKIVALAFKKKRKDTQQRGPRRRR